MKKKIKQKLSAVIFTACWFGIYLLTAGFEQLYISTAQYIVYSLVTFIVLGISGVLSGMFTAPDERRTK